MARVGAGSRLPDEPPTRWRLFVDCLLLGLTAWGGYMALLGQAQQRFVKQRSWINERDFADLIALVTLLPGPQAVNAIAVMGHRLLGWGGFAAALVGIVQPSFFVIIALWFGYGLLTGHVEILRAFTIGVLAPLAVLLAQAAVIQARNAAPGRRAQVFAAVAAGLVLALPYWFVPIAVLALAALVSTLFWPAPATNDAPTAASMRWSQRVLCIAPAALAVFQLVPALLPDALMVRIGLAFAGMSTTLFGGGLVMVPLLEGFIVNRLGWLDPAGFSAGLAASQLTPGPILGIATFTGMQVAGLTGALVATVGIYVPTAVISVGVGSVADQLKSSRRFQHAMAGVRCAVVGLIASAAGSLLLKLPMGAQPLPCTALLALSWLLVCRLRQPPHIALPMVVGAAWLSL